MIFSVILLIYKRSKKYCKNKHGWLGLGNFTILILIFRCVLAQNGLELCFLKGILYRNVSFCAYFHGTWMKACFSSFHIT